MINIEDFAIRGDKKRFVEIQNIFEYYTGKKCSRKCSLPSEHYAFDGKYRTVSCHYGVRKRLVTLDGFYKIAKITACDIENKLKCQKKKRNS